MYIKDTKGSYINFAESYGGNQGKVWKKASYKTGQLLAGSKVFKLKYVRNDDNLPFSQNKLVHFKIYQK